MEAIAPLTRYASPVARYQYLNSLAVEYGEVGKVQEAQNICKVILASPYAIAYPEWRETASEIALRGYKSRSVVSVVQPASENVVQLPVPDSSRWPVQHTQARLLNYAEWKKKMGKEPNGDEEYLDEMGFSELMVKFLQITAFEGVNEHKIRKIVKYAIKVMNEKD